jgi:hypothetical protein
MGKTNDYKVLMEDFQAKEMLGDSNSRTKRNFTDKYVAKCNGVDWIQLDPGRI